MHEAVVRKPGDKVLHFGGRIYWNRDQLQPFTERYKGDMICIEAVKARHEIF
jgi:hypothetical protein